MENHQTKHVCHRCVTDTYLANQLLGDGQLRICSYCYERRHTFALDELAEQIHQVVERHFQLTPDYPVSAGERYAFTFGRHWERRGCSPSDLVAEIAGLGQEIADDVVQHLSDVYAYRIVRHGGEHPYQYEARYEERGPDAGPFWNIWDNVPSSIQHQARFFNTEVESALDRLFMELDSLRTAAGESVLQVIGNDGEPTIIWRARRAGSQSQLQTILANPASEMGPPPPGITPAGRMNAAGIPVFYGALDYDTCIAEIRPPVGSYVVTGKFELLKPVRLLNLTLLQDIIIEKRYFDPEYADLSNRVAFLKQLAQELTKPVMPEDETTEYIATQVIAEYLAHKAKTRIDGIFFRSSQTDPPGENVVLFNHASRVDNFAVPPSTDVEIGIYTRYDDDDDQEGSQVVGIWEFIEPEPEAFPAPAVDQTIEDQEERNTDRVTVDPDPTLRLDVQGLTVHEINAIKPNYTSLKTARYRDNKPLSPF